MNNYSPLRPEIRITSQEANDIPVRRRIYYAAKDNEHRGEIANFPDLLQETKVETVDVSRLRDYPVAGTAINAANNAIEKEELDAQRLADDARAKLAEAHNVSIS